MKTIFSYKFLFLSALLTVAFASCKEENTESVDASLSVNTSNLTFEHQGGSYALDVNANVDWTIDKSLCTWVRFNALAGDGSDKTQSLTITADPNEGRLREGKVVVISGDKRKEIAIMQHSTVLSFGTPKLTGKLVAEEELYEMLLELPYSGGLGNEVFTVSFTMTGDTAGIKPAFTEIQMALTSAAGIIEVPLTGTPPEAGTIIFTFTTTATDPKDGSILTIPELVVPVAESAGLKMNDLRFVGEDFVATKPLGEGCKLTIPYTDALGSESFTLLYSVTEGSGITVKSEQIPVSVEIAGTGSIDIPLSGIPYFAGDVTFTVSTTEDFFRKKPVVFTLTKNVIDDGKRYYGGAFLITGVMPDPRGTDCPAINAAATFLNPHLNNTAFHTGSYEYMQCLALEDIDFSKTNYSIVCYRQAANTAPTNASVTNGWATGGSITYKFNLTEGTVSKGEFFYVGGTAMALNGYRNDKRSATWPFVDCGIVSMINCKWIRTISTADKAGDDFGSATTGLYTNWNANFTVNAIAAFKGTNLDKNTVPMDAVFYGYNASHMWNTSRPDNYLTVPLNDWYSPADKYFQRGQNTKLLDAFTTVSQIEKLGKTKPINCSEFHKFGGEIGIDAQGNKYWLKKRETSCIILNTPGEYIGGQCANGDDVIQTAAAPYIENIIWSPAKENEPNPFIPGDIKRRATIDDIEKAEGVTKITDQ